MKGKNRQFLAATKLVKELFRGSSTMSLRISQGLKEVHYKMGYLKSQNMYICYSKFTKPVNMYTFSVILINL